MNVDIKDIPAKLLATLQGMKKYTLFICILAVLGIFVFIVWQIRQYSSVQPTSDQVITKVNELNTPKLDQDAVNKILMLEDENITVEALFNQARENPFQE